MNGVSPEDNGLSGFAHETVLLGETVAQVAPRPGARLADVTAGGGGHSAALLAALGPDGRLLCIDRDQRAVEHLQQRFHADARVQVLQGEMGDLSHLLAERDCGPLDGIVADLGVSSPQLDEAERGFSLRESGPLDMRMDQMQEQTARMLIESCDEQQLADVLYKYGEERRSRPIARSILRALSAGELDTTADLRRAVVRVTGPKRGRIDPATRTFQALRIAVNDELGQLKALLAALPQVLADDGVAAIISFHSLEDRLVKHMFRDEARLSPLQRRPIIAGPDEAAQNPRARSAKLRAARRVPRAQEAL